MLETSLRYWLTQRGSSLILTAPFSNVHFRLTSLGSNNKLTRTVLNRFEGFFIIAWRRSAFSQLLFWLLLWVLVWVSRQDVYVQTQPCPRRLQIEARSLITTQAYLRDAALQTFSQTKTQNLTSSRCYSLGYIIKLTAPSEAVPFTGSGVRVWSKILSCFLFLMSR